MRRFETTASFCATPEIDRALFVTNLEQVTTDQHFRVASFRASRFLHSTLTLFDQLLFKEMFMTIVCCDIPMYVQKSTGEPSFLSRSESVDVLRRSRLVRKRQQSACLRIRRMNCSPLLGGCHYRLICSVEHFSQLTTPQSGDRVDTAAPYRLLRMLIARSVSVPVSLSYHH